MRYIDLNMIRAGVVVDPLAWKWTGYSGPALLNSCGEKKRNRLIDYSEVLRRSGHSQWESFQASYAAGLGAKSPADLKKGQRSTHQWHFYVPGVERPVRPAPLTRRFGRVIKQKCGKY